MKKVFIFSSIFFLIDLISKMVVERLLKLYQSITIIPNFFSITYVRNTGAAFSILKGNQILLIIIAIIMLLLIINYLKKENLNKYKIIYYSFIIGGILGNLFDRIVYNSVIDFLDFNILSYDAPIFNIADSFIVVGVILVIFESIGGLNGNRSRRI